MSSSQNGSDSLGGSGNISYFSLTAGGALLALKLRDRFGGAARLPSCHSQGCQHCDPFDNLADALPERFRAGDTLVCVMAAGIVFRLLAPHLGSKQEDPAVIVIDEEGRFVVPLLGGHAAGANRLARELAAFLGGDAVLTTSSDVQGLTAPDEVARKLGLLIADAEALRRVTAVQVNGGRLCIESRGDPGMDGYRWLRSDTSDASYDAKLIITHLKEQAGTGTGTGTAAGAEAGASDIPSARLIPRSVVAGIGCRRGVPAAEIVAAIEAACDCHGIDSRSIGAVASIDVKHDEEGLAEAASFLEIERVFYSANRLAAMHVPGSDFVAAAVGTPAVCEPAAMLAAGEGAGLISGKEAYGRVTVALALRAQDFRAPRVKAGRRTAPEAAGTVRVWRGRVADLRRTDREGQGEQHEFPEEKDREGRVLVVGTGAGTGQLLTGAAREALVEADVIVGYRTYVEQMRPLFPDKEFISGSMGAEIERCREALSLASTGKTVAMVSSGDPGVYGMAGPLLELADGVPVTIVPGVTAAQIAAARLGAPLMNDYITLSLSDLLTPREEVLRRARVAAASDLAICLYNPSSRKRRPLFEEVCEILAEERPSDTPAGWVREAGGPGETCGVTTLAALADEDIDMRTIIIVGNSRTSVIGGRMVTGRGYEKKSAAGPAGSQTF